MSAYDDLRDAISGIVANWPLVRTFVNGGETDVVQTGAGNMPTIAKVVVDAQSLFDQAKTDLIAQKDAEINQAADGVLSQTVTVKTDTEGVKADTQAIHDATADVLTQVQGVASSVVDTANATLAARDAALIGAGVYVNEPTGRAAVADGAAFKVQGDGNLVAASEYRRVNSTTSTLIAIYPTAKAALTVGGFVDRSYDDDGAHINPIRDGARRLLRWFDYTGARRGKLAITQAIRNGLQVTFNPATGQTDISFGTVEGNTPIGARGGYVSTYDDDGTNAMLVVAPDANGVKRIIMAVPKAGFSGGTPAEVITARGAQPDLNSRLSVALNPYGAIMQPVYGAYFLRETRQRLRALLDGDITTYVLALCGDSWTDGSGLPTNGVPAREYYYTRRLVMALQAAYGNAGAGWCCLKNPVGPATFGGSSNPNSLYQSGTGSWTTNTNNKPGASICSVQSSTPGDRITVNCALTKTASVALHYPVSAGVLQYRFNGGAWTQIDQSVGSGLQVAALTGFPTTAAWTLDIEPVSGTIELYGIDHRSGAPGIVVHGLGAGGSNAFHWGSVNQAQLQAAWKALGINAFSMLLGTNDQLSYTVSGHKSSMQTVINSMRAACPTADILLATSPENSDTTPPRPSQPMALFQEVDLELAIANKCAHLNPQYYFGSSISEYGYGTVRGWLNSSLIHPSQTGQRVLEEAFWRVLTQSI
ncbi:SGNH/GDSL hydrolase family protein [Paraburkholderia caribensis]|uniref:hypothetical protein n=1 Tax=Paraburkholderia caribensis TaxID=75105 RepID=UPI00071EBCC9|nr:hypothetical protein [Paraburkholderia caribensis]ALP62830.1 hypothetical protein AN416_09625 [Paraburkholderia caribensis]AUT51939.1 hypothetical protein C2L66_08775 [Paraburkholderia caribensis]